MGVVFWKELADHFSSRRFMILLALIVFTGAWATYASGQAIRQEATAVPTQYVFLLLLTSRTEALFSLATFLGFFGPLVWACVLYHHGSHGRECPEKLKSGSWIIADG